MLLFFGNFIGTFNFFIFGAKLDFLNKDTNRREMELNDKNRSKSKNSKKISSKSVRIHEFGRNPKRYLIGMIYIALNILVGLSSNPLTPIAVTVSKVISDLN